MINVIDGYEEYLIHIKPVSYTHLKKEGYEMSKRVSKKQSNPQLRAAVTSIVLTIALILLTAVVGGCLLYTSYILAHLIWCVNVRICYFYACFHPVWRSI